MLPLPPRSTLFPYTTLFRSGRAHVGVLPDERRLLSRDRKRPRLRAARQHRAARLVCGPVGTLARKPLAARLLRSEEHTSELQSLRHLVCRLLLEKKKQVE